MKLEGKKVIINRTPEVLYNYLNDFNNYQQLMPEQITNWNSDKNSCSFTIQGMANVNLAFGNNKPHSLIELLPQGKTPFSFSLHVNLTAHADKTEVGVTIDADLNPMLAMMAKRPMENLVNVMAQNLKNILD